MTTFNEVTARKLDTAATLITLAGLAAVLYGTYVVLDDWAVATFTRPTLSSALLAVIDLALFLLAIALSPLLSKLLRMLGGLAFRRR